MITVTEEQVQDAIDKMLSSDNPTALKNGAEIGMALLSQQENNIEKVTLEEYNQWLAKTEYNQVFLTKS